MFVVVFIMILIIVFVFILEFVRERGGTHARLNLAALRVAASGF